MADIKISELTTASEIKNEDNIELSQNTGNGLVSLKATILAIANKIVSNINFTSALQTNSKTITGAINEVAQGGGGGGSSTLDGLNDVDIDDTTLADGQALVYNGTEEKWVNGQGGGGTGGHIIIDENGNSMTARSGLQFVGGANVSDDATNNKTIVDLASAGGIDGAFIDTDNVVFSETINDGSIAHSTYSYTATEDCMVVILANGNPSGNVTGMLNGVAEVFRIVSAGIFVKSLIPMKKGQTLSFTGLQAYAYFAVFGIQTGTTHSKFQPIIYSTEEREIGVWEDGKPLYQKTFIVNPTQATETIDISSLHIDKMVSRNTTCTIDTGGSGIQQKDVQYRSESVGSDTYGLICEIRGTDLYFDISGYNYSQITEIRATLQYTKTTDVAGSGSWTPQGVPAVHYSTDEHIVGTWMGETLWEKTYDFSSNPISIPSSSNFMTSDIDSSNMGVITNVFANHSDGTLYNDMSADPTGNNHTKLKLKSVGGATAYYLTLQYTKSS